MDSSSAPMAWRGQQVTVALRETESLGMVGTTERTFLPHEGTLKNVNEFGIELEEVGEIVGAAPDTTFYPWGVIQSIKQTTP
jgi:hypothetical protein